MTASEIKTLVKPDRVHQRVYADPDIFDLEMERIFERTWVFAGHESRIPQPGDYFRARIGRKDIVVVRTDDGGLAGLLNRCPHRGGMLAGTERGHVKNFECPYHGWSFKRDGKLLGLPMPQGYGDDFDIDDPKWSMSPVGRIESYRGFIFVNIAGDGPDLRTFIEPVRDSLDNMVDRAPDGELIEMGGRFRQVYNGNWKVHVENTFDGVHAAFLHRSSWLAVREWEKDRGQPAGESDQMLQMIKANSLPISDWDGIALRALPHGHATLGGFYRDPKIAVERTDPGFAAYKEAMVKRHGAARTDEILALDRFNSLIYPNMVVNIRFHQVRLFHPIAPNKTILETFCFKMKGAPDELFHSAVRFLTSLNSPSSMISQDDHEMFGRMQRLMAAGGFGDEGSEWIDFSRLAGKDTVRGNEVVAPGTSEAACRNQWQTWLSHMAA